MNSEICECGKKRDKLNKTNWTRHVNSCTSKKRKILSNNSNIAKFFKTTTSVKDQNPTCHRNEALNSLLLPENNLSTCISDYTENTDGVCEEMSNSLSTSLLFSQSPMLISKSPIKLTKEQNPTCHQNEALNSQLLPENNLSTCTSDNTKNREMAFKNDLAGIPDSISHELLHYYVNLGPCQPSPLELPLGMFPKKRDWNGMNRSFNESFYNYSKIIPNNPPRRFWLSYSPSEDRIYCISCKLFGLPKAKKSN